MPKRITRNARDVAALNMARKSRKQISVCIMGSETCATAIAKVVGENCAKNPDFQKRVPMFVFDEMVNGKKLSRIINKTHVNVKYLPGHKLPLNVVAVGDEVKAVRNADIIIFVLPRQLLPKVCEALIGRVKKTAIGISLMKGFEKGEDGGLDLISRNISRYLEIPCSVLVGANLANDVAEEKFSEATIGCRDFNDAKLLRDLFQSDNFRVYVVDDADAVEVCGTLRNVVACGAGFVDGLGLGDNTKSAVIRLGLMEMIKFVQAFYPGGRLNTFFQSAGVADLVATCYGGPNRQVAEALVKSGKSLAQLEAELLKGQKLQGAVTAQEVNYMLKKEEMEDKFPLFTAVHKICTNELKPKDLIDRIRFHPDSMQDLKPGLPRGAATRRRIVSWMRPCCGPVVNIGGKCNRSSCRYHTWNRPLITPLPASLLTTRSCLHCNVNQRQQFSSICRYVPKWRNRLLSFCCAPKMRPRLALNLGMLLSTACALRLCNSSSF